jgi:antitoxin (DNA-binding transcriptional repressor) of toxin-antitoxin stability system
MEWVYILLPLYIPHLIGFCIAVPFWILGARLLDMRDERDRTEAANHKAKANLAKYLRRVAGGERILILCFGKPVAMLAPLELPLPCRQPGSLKGKIWFADNFDDVPFNEAMERIILGNEE